MTSALSIYEPEYYYFQKRPALFKKALLITSLAVSRYCKYYEVELLVPERGVKDKIRKGIIPLHREAFIKELIDWIFVNSAVPVFSLCMDAKPMARKRLPKFANYEGQCCWTLSLTPSEFKALQRIWRAHGFPSDLFFHENKMIHVDTTGKFAKVLGIKGTRSYTPLRWKELQKKKK